MMKSKTLKYALLPLAMIAGTVAFAQSDFGSDPEKCKENISLYQDAMSRDQIAEAYAPWSKILQLCPAWSKGVYQNGTRIMAGMIAKEEDAERKKRLIDSLYIVHDMRIQYFGEEAFVLGRKGLDVLIHEPGECAKALEILKRSIELGGASSEAGTLSAYYQALGCLYAKGEVTKEEMLSEYVIINGYLEENLSNEGMSEADREYYQRASDNVNNLFFKVAECADIGKIATDMVKADPENIELKERLLKVLNAKDCADEAIYRTLAEDVHKANPTSQSAYSLGMRLVRQNEMGQALRYMKEAVELCNDCPEKVNYLLKAGQVASAIQDHGQARNFANQVLRIEPNNGEALLLIGISIAAQASNCEDPQRWGVYWLAYDYYQRAKNDPASSEKAGERMASMRSRFPTSKDVFFYQLKDGQSFQVTCGGLNESTTVRVQ